MKTINLSMFTKLFLLASVIALSSCKKEEVEPEPESTTPNTGGQTGNGSGNTGGSGTSDTFYAKLDGVEFQETILSASEILVDEITISASLSFGGPTIQVIVPIDIAVGTYSFNEFIVPKGYYTPSLGSLDIYGTQDGVGNLTITGNNQATQQIEGTFEFTATPTASNSNTGTYNITEGAFSVTY